MEGTRRTSFEIGSKLFYISAVESITNLKQRYQRHLIVQLQKVAKKDGIITIQGKHVVTDYSVVVNESKRNIPPPTEEPPISEQPPYFSESAAHHISEYREDFGDELKEKAARIAWDDRRITITIDDVIAAFRQITQQN